MPEVDILVTDTGGTSLAEIQVKGRQHSKDGGWTMNAKHEGIVRARLFYCFVDLGDLRSDVPKCWIIPSKKVAEVLELSHKAWLDTPGRKGREHKNSSMRRIVADYAFAPALGQGWLAPYNEAWDLIRNNPSRSIC